MRISFFPTPEHKVFNYKPRFYDENKEEMKKRYEKYGKQYPGESDSEKEITEKRENADKFDAKEAFKKDRYIPGKSIRGSFSKELEEHRKEAGNKKAKKIILYITLAAAFVAAYYLAQGLVTLLR